MELSTITWFCRLLDVRNAPGKSTPRAVSMLPKCNVPLFQQTPPPPRAPATYSLPHVVHPREGGFHIIGLPTIDQD